MKGQQRRRKASKRRRRKQGRLIQFVFFCAMMIVACSSWRLMELDTSVEAKKQELLEKKEELTQMNAALRKEIELLNTPSYIEQLAREKLGLVRKGEILLEPKEDQE